MSFSGFSEDDIRKLKTQDTNKNPKGPGKNPGKKAPLNGFKSLPNNPRKNAQNVPEAAKLSQSETSMVNGKIEPDITENEPVKGKKFRDLDEFEAKQKLIEEQNRKRKELLAKALADRTKQTQEEAQKLNEIQDEFKKLDAILSGDVKILRKQIEAASLEKKYLKIEKEFLDAKVVLHQKQEKKEMLTEHLCTIIEKNEERKAKKLNELLERLQLLPTELNASGHNAK